MSSGERNRIPIRSITLLDEQINNCFDLAERNTLFAKKAAALTRHSFFEDAKNILSRLRTINSKYDPRLSAWIMFVEGQIEHFETLNITRARDKFVRAHLISQVAKDRELASATSAWLAHCDFVDGRLPDAAGYLAKAFNWSRELKGDARGRACMVLADGFNMAGDTITAKHWYSAARACAVEAGDIAMQNVMLFNSAAFHVSHLTLSDCVSTVTSEELKRTKLEVASASNLNAALGITSLSSMIPIMLAEVLVIEKEWSRAERDFSLHLPQLAAEGQSKQAHKITAQRAWCRANIGDRAGAHRDVQAASASSSENSDCDDLSVLHYRLAAASAILDEPELHEHHRVVADGYLVEFRGQQSNIRKLFTPIADSVRE